MIELRVRSKTAVEWEWRLVDVSAVPERTVSSGWGHPTKDMAVRAGLAAKANTGYVRYPLPWETVTSWG